jgi:hypothetical protein
MDPLNAYWLNLSSIPEQGRVGMYRNHHKDVIYHNNCTCLSKNRLIFI